MAAPTDLLNVLKNMEQCPTPGCLVAQKEMRDDMYGAKGDVAYLSQRSPLKSIKSIRVPVLIVQGERDEFVPKVQAEDFVRKAIHAGRDVRLLVLPELGHDLGSNADLEKAINNLASVIHFLKD